MHGRKRITILGYKPDVELPKGALRRLEFTSAQAWGADQIFDELFIESATHPASRMQ